MSMDDMWKEAAQTVVNAGMIPIMISETLIELLQALLTEEQASFIRVFDKPSLNIDQLRERSELEEADLQEMLDRLMHEGVVVGIPSRSTGIMVYRLLGPFPGMFEYTNLRGKPGRSR